ncbi:hypothetical protein ACF0H5_018496 [Mactra antiquata]
MSRFSNEGLYNLLRHITRWVEANHKPVPKPAVRVQFKLRSIKQLQEIMDSMKIKMKNRTPEEDTVFKNYEIFLNDLLYLKDLKKYFDDEIYSSLMKYHYNSSMGEVKNSVGTHGVTLKHVKTLRLDDDDSGNGSQAETDDRKVTQKIYNRKKSQSDPVDTDDEVKYKQTVNELNSILNKWDGLLSEEVLELNDFDPDSYHELMQFNNYSQFESLLRLVPDIFAKCYKCIDLAKTWLTLSNIVIKDEPEIEPKQSITPIPEIKIDTPEATEEELNTPEARKEFLEQLKEIQEQIESVNRSIEDDEQQLCKYNEEMDTLVGRDERFSTVYSQADKIDSLITVAAGEYQKAKTEQIALASKMKSCRKDTPTYTELKSHLQRLDTEVAQNHWKVKRLEFERAVVREDLLVEAEVRPSFIRFIGDTKEKMDDLKRFLQTKKDEKLKLEKQLALMKTNTDRMRKIMRSYLGSASTSDNGELTRESTILSLSSDTGSEVSVIPLVDGNEADDDSPTPKDKQKHETRKPSKIAVLHKPTLVKKDTRPSSEILRGAASPPSSLSSGRLSRTGPKAALKSTPRRVWENV